QRRPTTCPKSKSHAGLEFVAVRLGAGARSRYLDLEGLELTTGDTPMRLPAFLAAALLAATAASAAQAAPPGGIASINIIVGPELQDKAKDYGVREFDTLTSELLQAVERELRKTGSLVETGGRLDLVIEDAKPNRPTMRQLANTPGLSFESRGI